MHLCRLSKVGTECDDIMVFFPRLKKSFAIPFADRRLLDVFIKDLWIERCWSHDYLCSLLIIPCNVRSALSASSPCFSFGTTSVGPLPGGLPCHSKRRSVKSTPFPGIVCAIISDGAENIAFASLIASLMASML